MDTVIEASHIPACPGPIPARRERLWLAAAKKCHWCHRNTRLTHEISPDQATVDHVIPRYKGGTNEDNNCVSACLDCNGRRNHEDMCRLPDGELLGKNWKGFRNGHTPVAKHSTNRYVALTKDDKARISAIFPSKKLSSEEVLREQRDSGLRRISELEKEINQQKKEINDWKTIVCNLESISVRNLICKRLARWLLREKG